MHDDTTNPYDPLRTGACICIITVFAHLAGSAVFFGLIGGPFAVLFSPLLSIYGMFFILPEFIGIALQWLAYDPRKGTKNFWTILVVSVVLAGTFTGFLGPKEQGSEIYWTVAYVAAAATSAAVSLLAIRFCERLNLQRTSRSTEPPPVPRGGDPAVPEGGDR